jgi:hypothetical protein
VKPFKLPSPKKRISCHVTCNILEDAVPLSSSQPPQG